MTEATLETDKKDADGRRVYLKAAPVWVVGIGISLGLAVFGLVRTHDLERLQAVDLAGQKRGENNGNRIDAVETRLDEAERDDRASRDRIIRLEVATENQAKSLEKIETGVERLNVKVDEMRKGAQ